MIRPDQRYVLFGLQAHERSWRGLFLLISLYLGSLLFAALLAPFVFGFIQWFQEVLPNRLTHYLSYKGFEDYFDRLRWVPIVIALPYLFKKCGLFSLKAIGLSWQRIERARFMKYFTMGALLCVFIFMVQISIAGGTLKAGIDAVQVLKILFSAIASGLVLGVLEELVFRGFILRIFYTAMGPLSAILLSSLFFAWVHFKMPDTSWREAFPVPAHAEKNSEIKEGTPTDVYRVTWKSGFFVAWKTLQGPLLEFHFSKFLSLFALGVLLSTMVLSSVSLMQAIGFHAGLVAAMLSCGKLVSLSYEKLPFALQGFLGGRSFTDGSMTAAVLTLLALASICHLSSRKKPASRTQDPS